MNLSPFGFFWPPVRVVFFYARISGFSTQNNDLCNKMVFYRKLWTGRQPDSSQTTYTRAPSGRAVDGNQKVMTRSETFHWPQPFEKFSGEEEGSSGTIVSFPGLTIADELAATPAAMAGQQQKAPCANIVRRPVLVAAPGTAEIQLPFPAQTP